MDSEQVHRSDLAEAVVSFPKLNHLASIEAIRWVVKHHQAARVRGCFLDATSANMILQVFNRLNPTNQAKMADMPVKKMFEITCAILKKVS